MADDAPTPRGSFITVEGIDGAGKSTHVARLAATLAAAGHEVVCTREPGATALGREIRRILLETDMALSPDAELLLFLADRADHLARVVRPALARGAIVLCDRFSDSTIAYQGHGRRADLGRVRRWDAESRDGLMPDLTLLLDCPVEEAARRRQRDRDRYQVLDADFHERVRAGFLAAAESDPVRVRRIDATRSVDAVSADIAAVTLAWLRQRAGARRSA
jgi:dTMP kinase